jgi:16S rRNA (cytidine1402-2'-O)-methyltransferase
VVPIPGPSAILAALIASGLAGDRFAFLGFVPRRGAERREVLARVAGSPETTVLFESPQRLADLLEALADACGPDRPAAVARELTKLHEEIVRGTLEEVNAYYRQHPPKGEVTVVVAPAAESEAKSADADLQEEARGLASRLLAGGMKPSAAAKELTARLDLARNDAYRVVQESLRHSARAVPEPPA